MSITQIKLRRDTSANWTTRNPTLALGEPGLELDTLKVKYGDGTTPWNTLPYPNVGQGPQGAPGVDGAPGADGAPGTNGLSAYEIAVSTGFNGTEADWLAFLVGAPGAQGNPGNDGAPGNDGLSAYDVAVANGFIGTEAAWLASLVGPAGQPGTPGSNGSSENTQAFVLSNSDNFNVDQMTWSLAVEQFTIASPFVSYNNGAFYLNSQGIYKITVQAVIYPADGNQWVSSVSTVGTEFLTEGMVVNGVDKFTHFLPAGIDGLSNAVQSPAWVDQYLAISNNNNDAFNIKMFTEVPNDFVPAYGATYVMTVIIEKLAGTP